YAIFNFSGSAQEYEIELPENSKPELLLNTDWDIYSGDSPQEKSGRLHSPCSLPPFSGILIKVS
ncbi:MAG: alpha amylase C-terminal domain-containing protein, partial [Clostridiales bacterium]|nr:alpha amylase C-terminal domain-containing protein [Clostridiales bacterium]